MPPATVRIRTSRAALPVVLLLAVCVSPLALVTLWSLPLFLVPLAALGWVLRAGVDLDGDGLTVRALFGRRRVAWSEAEGLLVRPRGGVLLVLSDGRRLRLPTVRAGHLPVVAAMSGGRFPVPGAPAERPDQ